MGAKQDVSQAVASTLWNPTQGLITVLPPHAIPDLATAECDNFYGFEGKLRPRPGWSVALATVPGSATNIVYGLAEHVAMSGTRTIVALTQDYTTGAVKFYEWTGAAWTDRTGAVVLTGSVSAPYHPTFANFKGVLYFTTGLQGMAQWTGPGNTITLTTNTDPLLAPFDKPKIVISWDGRLFTFNSDDAPSAGNPVPPRVAWSDFLDGTIWQGGLLGGSAGFQDLYYGDDSSDGITAAIDLKDNLLVWKPRSMYAGVNTGDAKFYEFRPIFRDIGCVGQNTVRRLQDTVIWLGYDNVYMMEGLQKPEPIGDLIRTHIQAVTYTKFVKYAHAVIDPIRQLYHLFMPDLTSTSSSNHQLKWFIFNMREKSWWEGTIANFNIQPYSSVVVYTYPFDCAIYCGSIDQKVYKLDHSVYTDSGTKYTCRWVSKLFDAGKLFKTSSSATGAHEFDTFQIQKLAVMAQSGKCKTQLRMGPSLDQTRLTDVLSLDFRGIKSDRYVTFRDGDRFVQLILTETDLTAPAEVEGLTMHIQARGMVI